MKNVGLSIEMMRALAFLKHGCSLVRLPGGTWMPKPNQTEERKGFSTLTVRALLKRELAEIADWRVTGVVGKYQFVTAVRLRPDYSRQPDTPHPLPSPTSLPALRVAGGEGANESGRRI